MYTIHSLEAHAMKLQRIVFLLPAINMSASIQFKTALGFSSVHTEISLLPSP